LTLADANTLLQGEPRSTVDVVVRREGSDTPIHFVLTRQRDEVGSVPLAEFLHGDEELGIGYIKLTSFQQNSHREFRKGLNDLRDTGKLKAVVIDLRDNLGGYVDAAVAISEMFVPKGSTVLTMRGRMPSTMREYRTDLEPIDGDVPVIVLMNGLSASASEILAGAIQDLDRGVIVGSTSFGKGLVQTVQALPHNSALKLTIARYYTPSGRSIQAIDYRAHDGSPQPVPDSLRTLYKTSKGRTVKDGRGIEPDITTRPGGETEIEMALKRQSAFFFFANSFAAEHDTIAIDFSIDDQTYDAFKKWLSSRDFEYRASSDEALEELATALRTAGYGNDEAIEVIRAFIRQEKERDLDRYRDRLESHLRSEIAARYFEYQDQIRSQLLDDPDIETAIELVRNGQKYRQVLR
jgi:carboxyl-terminal processing protease